MQKSLMPKGVDHFGKRVVGLPVILVQKSLMPKGVDHVRSYYFSGKYYGAKIFDAERR